MISDDDIKREFLAAGFTIKPGLNDLKPYVYDAARRVLALAGHGGSTAWRCDCGANLYIDGEGRPRSKAEPWRNVREQPPTMHARVFVVALDADDEPYVTTAHFNGFDKRGPIFLGTGNMRHTSKQWAPMLPLPRGAQRPASPATVGSPVQGSQTTHSADCWRWHHKCAVAKIERECGQG